MALSPAVLALLGKASPPITTPQTVNTQPAVEERVAASALPVIDSSPKYDAAPSIPSHTSKASSPKTAYITNAISYEKTVSQLETFRSEVQGSEKSVDDLRGHLRYLKDSFSEAFVMMTKAIQNAYEKDYYESEAIFFENPKIVLSLFDFSDLSVLDAAIRNFKNKGSYSRELGELKELEYYISNLGHFSSHRDVQLILELFDRLPEIIRSELLKNAGCITTDRFKREPLIILTALKNKCGTLQSEIEGTTIRIFSLYYPILASDSEEECKIKTQLNKLHILQTFLHDVSISNSEIVQAFLRLSPDLKAFLQEAIYHSCGSPKVHYDFGLTMIYDNPRFLCLMKNHESMDVVAQISEHLKTNLQKLQAQRFQALLRSSSDKSLSLSQYNLLSQELRNKIEGKIWEKDGRPEVWEYGTSQVKENPWRSLDVLDDIITNLRLPSLPEAMDRIRIEIGCADPLSPKETSVDPLRATLSPSIADTHYGVAIVTAELQGVVSAGGLAGAVFGMAKSISNRSVVIMPKYSILQTSITGSLRERPDLYVNTAAKACRVFERIQDGVTIYFIDDEENFKIHYGTDIYNGANHDCVMKRFARFQSYAADLAMKLYQRGEIEVLHVHDSQAALVPKIIARRYEKLWARGETPATVFTFHNNLSQSQFHQIDHHTLWEIGLEARDTNSFVEGLEVADTVTTVSKTFAKEAQGRLFGRGVDDKVRHVAAKHKLFGIVNGDNIGWNPKTDAMLRKWKDVETGAEMDLTYGPEDSPEEIATKQTLIREQLAKYVQKNGLGRIDPTKPILLYLGRYDYYQKGLDKLPAIMDQALKSGAQIIVIGTNPDEQARDIIEGLKAQAAEVGNNGAIVIVDEKGADGRLRWQQGSMGSQGFGSLLRAAADMGCFPSSFEPCGLVQGETWCFGKRVFATDVGGFHDTVITHGPEKNGTLFPRAKTESGWMSMADQLVPMQGCLAGAIEEIKALKIDPTAHANEMKGIMERAKRSTWTGARNDGELSAAEQYRYVYGESIRKKAERGTVPFDAHLA